MSILRGHLKDIYRCQDHECALDHSYLDVLYILGKLLVSYLDHQRVSLLGSDASVLVPIVG